MPVTPSTVNGRRAARSSSRYRFASFDGIVSALRCLATSPIGVSLTMKVIDTTGVSFSMWSEALPPLSIG